MLNHPYVRKWLYLLLAALMGPVLAWAEESQYSHQGTVEQLRRDGRTLIVAIKNGSDDVQYKEFWLSTTPPVIIHAMDGSVGGKKLLRPTVKIGFNTGLYAKPEILLVPEIWVLSAPIPPRD
ncbi:MAG: hypothetical protein G8345_01140 [Magnetococcales bacterium]|nr:hypothetical protein [Magnetococcales bacterium]NGZ25475.1 hypothetical protein [Magnetococcales bacterium]